MTRPRANQTAQFLSIPLDGGRILASILAIGCSISGLYLLWQHGKTGPQPLRAPAGLVLVIVGLTQLRLLSVLRRTNTSERLALFRRRNFWRWMLIGSALSYAASVVAGPSAGASYVLVVVLAAWYTSALVREVISDSMLAAMRPILERRAWRIAGSTIFLTCASVISLEVVLRVYDFLAANRAADAFVVRSHQLRPGSTWQGRLVNNMGYWDDDFVPRHNQGLFRVAALGDRVILSGTSRTNCLAVLEYRINGVEIYHFGLSGAGPRQYVAQLLHDVAPLEPHLALVFISVGDDIAQPLEVPGVFDWRSLRTCQCLASWTDWTVRESDRYATGQSPAPDRETYLHNAAERLVVCRTPLNAAMNRRWQETFAHLDALSKACLDREIQLALVLVPGEFQVDDVLLRELCRRQGCASKQFDLELPQRRLASFAEQRGLAVLDLLPHLRAANQSAYERNEGQLSERGNQLVGEALGRWLEAQVGGTTSDDFHASTR